MQEAKGFQNTKNLSMEAAGFVCAALGAHRGAGVGPPLRREGFRLTKAEEANLLQWLRSGWPNYWRALPRIASIVVDDYRYFNISSNDKVST
jgi:hypothetical protein